MGKNQLRGELDENSWLLSKNFKTKDILKTSNVFWKKRLTNLENIIRFGRIHLIILI